MAVNPYFMFEREPAELMKYGEVTGGKCAASNVLRDEGRNGMELQETFFAKGHAMLIDKFFIKWQLSCPNA